MGKKINVTIDVEEFSKAVAEDIMNQLKEKMETCATDCESIRKAIEGLNDDEFLIYANADGEEDEEKNEDLDNYDKILDILSSPEYDDKPEIDKLFEWVHEKKHREKVYGPDDCISKEELSAILIAAQRFKREGDGGLYTTLIGLYDRKC